MTFVPPLQLDRFRVQASVSWRCTNYDFKNERPYPPKCQYCNLWSPSKRENSYVTFGSKALPIKRELSAREWIIGMHKVRQGANVPVLWDFTGGEPLLYDELPALLEGARSYSDWAITSNTVLTRRLQGLFNANIDMPTSWTASWHPNGGFDIEDFIANLHFIRSHGVYVSVTIVLHHSTKATIKTDLARFAGEGFFTQVHLFHAEGFDLEQESDDELVSLYADLKHLNRAPAESHDRTPEGYGEKRDCVAGYRSVAVSSDGSVYPCYRGMMNEPDPPIGQWGRWAPAKEIWRDCSWPCTYACDLRNVIVNEQTIRPTARTQRTRPVI